MTNDTPGTRSTTPVLVFLFIVTVLFAVLTAVPAVGASPNVFDCASASVNVQDCQALVELYESTNGSSWTDKSNWLSGSPCSATDPWYGVTCDGDRVQQIILTSNNLVGTLPAAVLNLEALTLLHVGMNRIGGAIPEITIDDSPMIGLYLNQNAFEGQIPPSLGKLSSLEFLYLNGNILTGVVPAELCSLKPISEPTGSFSLNHNALVNDELISDACLDTIDGQWRSTQTVAPEPRLKSLNSATTINDGQLTIKWAPIDFTYGDGFYEVFMSTESGVYGDFAAARTTTKEENHVLIGGIEEGVDYFFVVRTKSFSNEFNPNVVTSEFSDEITNNPVALTLADFQAVEQEIPAYIIIAAVLLLGILSLMALAGEPGRE